MYILSPHQENNAGYCAKGEKMNYKLLSDVLPDLRRKKLEVPVVDQIQEMQLSIVFLKQRLARLEAKYYADDE